MILSFNFQISVSYLLIEHFFSEQLLKDNISPGKIKDINLKFESLLIVTYECIMEQPFRLKCRIL